MRRFSWVPVVLVLAAACGGGSTGPDPDPDPVTGSLAIQVQGLPSGTAAAIEVTGPNGYSRSVSGTTTLADLVPGTYAITRSAVASAPYSFAPTSATANAQVTAGATATAVVGYAATTGALQVSFGGLPNDVSGTVTVSGPSGYLQQLTAAGRLDNLAPGAYTVAANTPGNAGLVYSGGAAANVTVTAGATANRAVSWALPIAPRIGTDRPGDGGSVIKVMYLVPQDGVDRQLDTDGTIHRTISSAQRWLASQVGGRAFRLDLTDAGELDIVFVRLPRTDGAYTSYGTYMRDSVEKDLAGLGLITASTRYLAYHDGGNTTACASAPRPPAHPGRLAGIYLKGTIPGAAPCASNPLASSATAPPGYFEFVMLHELLHVMGAVDGNAPDHAFDGHVGHDPSDLMYAGVEAWTPSRIDQQRRNYFNAGGLPGGLLNLAQSAFLLP